MKLDPLILCVGGYGGGMMGAKIAHAMSEELEKEITYRVISCEDIILAVIVSMTLVDSSRAELIIGRLLRLAPT